MKKILLIDDNLEDRVLYRRFLGQQVGFHQFEITEATSGADGLEQFQLHRPDCILLDNSLPDTDGLAIARKMVEKLGGELWVDSTLGHGATFYFSLSNNL